MVPRDRIAWYAALFAVPLLILGCVLNPLQPPSLPTESIALDAEPLQDGDEELRQRQLFHFRLALPSGIHGDFCAGLIVFVSFAKLEIAAVAEAECFEPGRTRLRAVRE